MSDTGDESPADSSTREQAPADVARQTPPARFAPGDPVPNLEMWLLERWLGGGGFGEVWLARHQRKGFAAVKFCTDPEARHRLVTHEKAVVARVMKYGGDHPNIVPLLECNLSGDIPWLMYEYVEGGTLAESVAGWHTLPPPRRLGRTVRTLHAITGALAKFHRLDPPLIHRDLKPQNVLMSGETPRITDFGIGGVAVDAGRLDRWESTSLVRMPTMLHAVGSSRYAPPEQMFGSTPNPRDDVFAIGVLAYQMVLGNLSALPGPDAAAELRAMKIPTELAAMVVRSVAMDPDLRPKDAGEWETMLAALVRKKTVAARNPARPADESRHNVTEMMPALSESGSQSSIVTQTLTVNAGGRWYSRPSDQSKAEWQIVATTPADVQVTAGEFYRFSIKTTGTERDVAGIRGLSVLRTLVYLNLSYCAGVTDEGLEGLKNFTGLQQLFLRACPHITDTGLLHLYGLTSLRTLELTDCTHITAGAVAALRAALSNCRIQH